MKRGVLVVLALLAGCATSAEKIATRLEAAGVPSAQSRCMGDRLASRLSYGQLQELNRVVGDAGGEKLTVNRIVRRLDDADPALVSELVRTGLGCAI